MEKIYFCIDLKSFYASVECVDRNLDPFKTNLVVADPSRGNGAICLAVSPAMKKLGVKNRCRIYEIPKNIKYIVATPRMKKYMDYSSKIYEIYLKYVSKEDIHVYSIDEAFLDVTNYLNLYNITYEELCIMITKDILNSTGITASAGIGTNLYLAKVALDIMAKRSSTNIGFLDEELYKKELWYHKPLKDFWQIGSGISNRLKNLGIETMYEISVCPEHILYKEFGVNAKFMIDHSIGKESCTIKDIKSYKPKSKSLSFSQILFEDYSYEKAKLILKEMIDNGSLELINKGVCTDTIHLHIGYSKDKIKSSSGSQKLIKQTNIYSILLNDFLNLYERITDKNIPIRKIEIAFSNIETKKREQLNLFSNYDKEKEEEQLEVTINEIKNKHGKNSILRGISLEDGATAKQRNKMIGGHKSGE